MKGPLTEAFAIIAVLETGGRLEFSTPGYSSPNVRLPSSINMIRTVLAERRRRTAGSSSRPGRYVFQFDDIAYARMMSVGFGREIGSHDLVGLIMDPYFFYSRGFDGLRTAATAGEFPPWKMRHDTLFWRGRGTHGGSAERDVRSTPLSEVPRIQLALRLRDHPNADVGMIGPWIQPDSDADTVEFFQKERIFRQSVTMAGHSRYKYLLDIDGVANAWSTLERLLCGACVLKVASPYEMWYYQKLIAWRHYVPVRADFLDVDEKLDWCLSHPAEAEAIADAGQQLALAITYDRAMNEAVDRFSECRL